jgi:drug/metabolite transporter (DMT)-like permease
MAQTKRKRRTKHRGNAAGMVEARGRTGRRLTPEEQRRAANKPARGQRELKPPTWQRAVIKAAGFAILLFVLTQTGLFGRNTSVANSLVLAALSLLLYIPAAYATDRWAYNRQERRKLQSR